MADEQKPAENGQQQAERAKQPPAEAPKEAAREAAPAAPPAPRGDITFAEAVPAQVQEIVGRTGMRGEGVQVRCLILEGRDKNKTIRRNVKGPIRVGDTLMLTETEIEAQRLNTGRRG